MALALVRVQCRVVPCLISVIGIRGDPTRDNTAPCAALWDSEWTSVQLRQINQAMRLLDVEKSVMPIESQFKITIRLSGHKNCVINILYHYSICVNRY